VVTAALSASLLHAEADAPNVRGLKAAVEVLALEEDWKLVLLRHPSGVHQHLCFGPRSPASASVQEVAAALWLRRIERWPA